MQKKCQSSNIRENILQAAQYVLVNDGHSAFTMRQVAIMAGISTGHLTYYFPRKQDLLQILVSKLLDDYIQHFKSIFVRSGETKSQLVERLVHWVMNEVALDEETVRFAREVWVLALHDDDIKHIIDDFYDELIEQFVAVVGQNQPDLHKTTINELVYLLIILSEGTLVLFGTRQERTLSVEQITEVASRMLVNMICKEESLNLTMQEIPELRTTA
jgi:AcrR family transcriptional regulator